MKLPTRLTPLAILSIVACPALFFVFSCTSMPMQLTVKNTGDKYPVDTIISARTGQAVTFDALLKDLVAVRIVYVGETHTNPAHHAVQTRLIEALAEQHPALSVGMEMFDHRYDPVLAQWRAGSLDRDAFIKKSHWYVRRSGWGFDFDLYAPIFDTIQAKGLRLVGLNVPFWIPPKISASGLDNLLPD